MTEPKHICFITQSFPRRDSLIVHRQGNSLVNSGYKVSYIVCDGNPDEVRHGIFIKSIDLSYQGFFYKLFSLERHAKAYFERRAKKNRLKRFLKNYEADIYQINDFELLSLGMSLKRMGKCVTYNLREYYPVYYSRRSKNSIVRFLRKKTMENLLGRVARNFDAIFSCMPEMHDYINKVMPCKHFVDVANFPVVDKSFSLSYEEYCSRNKCISYFGTIYKISCQESLLEILPEFPDVSYVLAGVFYDQQYKSRLLAMPGWKQVRFINGFKREELPSIINSSIIGNVVKDFNQTETPQGSYSIIKIFETMEAAVPVILAKVPLYEEMVEKYHCGICVNPHSPEDFKNAIKYLLDNPKEAYEMGQNGRRAVLMEFSWDKEFEKYLGTIRLLTGEVNRN